MLATWWLVHNRRAALGLGRLSIIGTGAAAFIAWQTTLVVITELLSLRHALTYAWLVATWTLFAVAACAAIGAGRWQIVLTEFRCGPARLYRWATQRSALARCVLAVATLFTTIAVILGVLYWPNTTDSLVYHLPRVMQWQQQRSVVHFPTHYLAQIEFAPLHEFNMLHLLVLSGSDRILALPQALAFAVVAAAAAEICRLLGGSPRAQALAALLLVTLPSAVLEASSTQNNLFGTAIGTALVMLVLALPTHDSWLRTALWIGAAGGLAWLAKGTIAPLVGPALLVAVGFAIVDHRGASARKRFAGLVGSVAVATIVAAVLAGPFIVRNYELFDAPSGPVSKATLNHGTSPRQSVGNILRAITTNYRIADDDDGLYTAVQELVLGTGSTLYGLLDVDPYHPLFTIGQQDDGFNGPNNAAAARSEDFGANPWHMTITIFALIAATIRRPDRRLLVFLVAAFVGFAALAASTRWTVLGVRYQEPFFAIALAAGAIFLSRLPRTVMAITVAALVLAAGTPLLSQVNRQLIPLQTSFASPLDRYLGGGRFAGYAADVEQAVALIDDSGCERLGIGNWILLEYPVWAALRSAGWNGTIHHVDVTNESGVLADPTFEPCALIGSNDIARSPFRVPTDWETHDIGSLAVILPASADETHGSTS